MNQGAPKGLTIWAEESARVSLIPVPVDKNRIWDHFSWLNMSDNWSLCSSKGAKCPFYGYEMNKVQSLASAKTLMPSVDTAIDQEKKNFWIRCRVAIISQISTGKTLITHSPMSKNLTLKIENTTSVTFSTFCISGGHCNDVTGLCISLDQSTIFC